jgi:hypothetical protein
LGNPQKKLAPEIDREAKGEGGEEGGRVAFDSSNQYSDH